METEIPCESYEAARQLADTLNETLRKSSGLVAIVVANYGDDNRVKIRPAD